MFSKAVEWGYIRESPFKGVKLLTYEKKPPRLLTKEEVRKLLEAASPWLRPIIIVMLSTGILYSYEGRISDNVSLNRSDFPFSALFSLTCGIFESLHPEA